jgi:hypothetical protein
VGFIDRLKKSATSADLRVLIDELEKDISAKERQLADLKEKSDEIVLGDDREALKWRATVNSLTDEIGLARERLAALGRRLASAAAAEAHAVRVAEREAAVSAVTKTNLMLATYDKHAKAIADILAQAEQAKKLAERFNRDLENGDDLERVEVPAPLRILGDLVALPTARGLHSGASLEADAVPEPHWPRTGV